MAAITADVTNSTLTLNGRVFNDFIEGDFITLAYQNPSTTQTQGVNNGVVAKRRSDANMAVVTVRLLRYSQDDSFIQTGLNEEEVSVYNGSLKTNFTRDGVDGTETYTLTNGTIQNRADDTKNNQDGNDVIEYELMFSSAVRSV